ncbi:MAG: YciI-like protein [Christiangramia sp.]|nr:hypothetical protein [Christiangramia sp.]
MAYFILFYETVDDYLEKRGTYRQVHLQHAENAKKDGHLVLAGAFANPADGAALIFKSDSPEIAEAFAKNDPYVQNGLIKNWSVREWTVVIE